ncbi:MAG: hypothetical protein DKM50_08060 [Candidatus Margulisiibacteriota bacterium]|nr:MAG: hypothetical protein A2X41_04670 [Candidatus Margulisbacteria bacterium GWE2_39_32]PZM79649.1 MAG: hypothetical protein DKM50_08060 [Candidatus Margulisiibacteriota bacterium]HCY36267.1 hypothetical protein [Candidatus Margulisiibacteriota bacterium]
MQLEQKIIATKDNVNFKMSAAVYFAMATGHPNQIMELMLPKEFSPSNIKNYQNSINNNELPYIVSNAKNINVIALDMDFMGKANHIDAIGAEKVKYNILEGLHNKFGGSIMFAQTSAKFYAIVSLDKLPEHIKAQITLSADINKVITQGVNEVLGNKTVFNYSDKEGRNKNMANELQIPLLELNHAAVSTPEQGKNPIEFLDKLMKEAKLSQQGAKTVNIKVQPQDINSFTEPYRIDLRVKHNIAEHLETFKEALQNAEQMLPTEFEQKKYEGFTNDTREVLRNYNLSKWTQFKFNNDETLVYNKQAVIKLLDTLNALTQTKLKDALTMEQLTPDQKKDIMNDLKKVDGTELSSAAKTVLGKYTYMITADGAAIGAQNYSLGWNNTDKLNYTLVCQQMNERLKTLGFEKVIVAVTGGDEFCFLGISKEIQSPETRKKMELELARVYGEVLSNIKSSMITVTKEDIVHSLHPNTAIANKMWEINCEYAKKYAQRHNIPLSDLLHDNSITMNSGAFPIPYNKCYINTDAFNSNDHGKELLGILQKYGLVPENPTGIYELKVNLSKEEVPTELLDLLLATGIIRVRQGVDGSASVNGENPEGFGTAQRLADGDNYTQIAKARGRSVLRQDIENAIDNKKATLDYIISTYFKPTANSDIILIKDRNHGNTINSIINDDKLKGMITKSQLDKLVQSLRKSSSIITQQELNASESNNGSTEHDKQGMTPNSIPNLQAILSKYRDYFKLSFNG